MTDMRPELSIEPADDVPLPVQRDLLGVNLTPTVVDQKVVNILDIVDIPVPPKEFGSIEEFHGLASSAGHDIWKQSAVSKMHDAIPQWQEEILKNGGEGSEILKNLSNPEWLENTIEKKNFFALIGLRKYSPDAWRDVINSLSKRQKIIHEVGSSWVKTMPDEEISKLSLSREELEILYGLAIGLQEPVDQAFIKQLSKADEPGGMEAGFHDEVKGSEFVYISEVEGREKRETFAEVFEEDFRNIALVLNAQKNIIDMYLSSDKIDSSYLFLSTHLDLMIKFARNTNTDFEVVDDMREQLSKSFVELASSGCPILPYFVEGSSVSGDNRKNDVGVTIALRTESQVKEQENFVSEYDKEARQLSELYKNNPIGAQAEPGKCIFDIVFTKTGPELYWDELGMSGESGSLVNINEVRVRTKNQYEKVVKLFENPPSFEEYINAVLLTTYGHEGTGHGILNLTQDALISRIKKGYDVDKFDEIKADAVAAIPYYQLLLKGKEPVSASAYISVLLGWYLTENEGMGEAGAKEFDSYSFTGDVIAMSLLESGFVKVEDGKVKITDAKKGVKVLSEIGNNILDMVSAKKGEINSQTVSQYVSGLERRVINSKLMEQYNKLTQQVLRK